MSFRSLAIWGAALAAAYVAGIVASGTGWNPLSIDWNFENTGQFGDSFGPLSTFMAGLAAVGALGAYFSQKAELERIKEDAALERKLSNKRDFESTFFNLISLFRDTVADVEVNDQYGQNPKRGRDAIQRIVHEQIGGTTGSDDKDKVVYTSIYRTNRDDLGHYFRILYQIVRYVDESHVDDKAMYIRVLRANLSNAEMVLLGLNCVYGGGYPKFKTLVERHALLHNISSSAAISRRLDKNLAPGAFGDRDLIADSKN